MGIGRAPSSPPSGKAAGGSSAAAGDPSTAPGPGRPEVLEYAHSLLAWAVPAIAKFPRSYRFTLGKRIERRLYGILELLIRATYAGRGDKLGYLRDANVELEILRHELRIGLGFRLLTDRQIEHATRLIDSVGRQVGGWIKGVA